MYWVQLSASALLAALWAALLAAICCCTLLVARLFNSTLCALNVSFTLCAPVTKLAKGLLTGPLPPRPPVNMMCTEIVILSQAW